MTLKHLDRPFKIKEISDTGEFAGYGSIFGNEDSYGDIVEPGAFIESLKEKQPAMLWQHDTREPIGIYTDAREDSKGLYLEGRLLIDEDPLAKRAHAHLKAGSISGMSIGYHVKGYEVDSDDDYIWHLTKLDLWEVSLVTFPANDQARVHDVKSMLAKGQFDERTVELALRDVGFSRRQAKTVMSGGYRPLNQRDADGCLTASNNLINLLRGKQ